MMCSNGRGSLNRKEARMKPKKKYDFHYSSRKKCFVVKNTSICVEQLGDDEWHAYRAIGVYPCMDFLSIEAADGKSPISAVNALLRKEEREKKLKKNYIDFDEDDF